MCDSDIETVYDLYDRVIIVRLGTGVPLGTRGTIIGVMLGQTHLDTYYEVLFDHLPKNSLDAILLAGNNQQCRIKVRSYHLLNYSHSLRVRSMANYQQTRSMPSENVWEKRLLEPSTITTTTTTRQTPAQPPPPTRILKRTTNDTNSTTPPKSAPPSSTSTQEKSNFVEVIKTSIKEQQSTTNPLPPVLTEKSILSQPVPANSLLFSPPQENSMISPPPIAKLPEPEITFFPTNTTLPITNEITAPLTAFPTNPGPDSLFFRAIQESKQINNPVQQPNIQSAIVRQPWDVIPPPQLPVVQQKPNLLQQQWDVIPPPQLPVVQQKPNSMTTSIQQSWGTNVVPSIPVQQQPVDQFISRQQTWETSPQQQSQNTCM
jgi:hypothetical protein